MKWIGQFLIVMLFASSATAVELIPKVIIDGKVYHDVRWGPVNQGMVVMFHSRGHLTVPLSSLPPEYQALLGYQPSPTSSAAPSAVTSVLPPSEPVEPPKTTPPSVPNATVAQDAAWEAYNQQRKIKVLLNNKLVDRSSLTVLVGFVGNPVRIINESVNIRGTILELAERKSENAAANELILRPNLWQRTGTMVLLRNYRSDGVRGALTQLFVAPAEDFDGYKTYDVAQELSFEQWKQLQAASGLSK